MRRKLCVVTLAAAMVLGGCATDVPDLSHVDNNIAAQYVADALLSNDKHYDESLDYDHTLLEVTPTPEPTQAPTPKPQQSADGQGASVSGDGDGALTEQSVPSVSLSELYGGSGITVTPTSYEIKDSYGSQDYAVVTPQKGKKLAVVYFKIANTTKSEKRVNLAKKNISATLLVNGKPVGSPLLSIADGDLQTFNEKIGAGKKKQGVLLFEVSKSAKIASVEVQFGDGSRQANVSVH